VKSTIAPAALAAALLGLLPAPAAADELPPLSIYGFARLDLIVDDSTMSDVERPMYVDSEASRADDAEMSLHPHLTRLGLSVDRWRGVGPFDVEGKLEVDFQNRGQDSMPTMQLRHAYFALSARDKVELLCGQTWDLISPLFPAANNDTLLWNAGNTGDRRPQLRLTATPIDALRYAIAIGMTGAVDAQDLDGDQHLDGVESAVPMIQWLVEFRKRVIGETPMRIGVWGHFGKEQLADRTELDSRSFGAHLFFPLHDRFTLLGELFAGHDLSDIRGGIGQGVNPVTGEEIHAAGGWFELVGVIDARHMLATGSSFDFADPDDLEDGDRERNMTWYIVQRYRPHKSIQLGAEYIRWVTDYKNTRRGAANRFDFHMAVYF